MKWLAVPALLLSGCAAITPAPRGEKIVHNVVFASPNDYDLHLDVYLPRGDGPFPVVLWFHGGGWKYGHQGWMLYLRKLTREGFAVVSAQYRLSGRAQWPAQIDDCRAALRWLEREGPRHGLDSRQIFLGGASAGGHLAAMLGLMESKDIRAVAAFYPPTNLAGFENQDSHKGYIPELLGGSVNEKRALAEAASPVNHVTAEAPPFILLHGDRDKLVPIAHSKELYRQLARAGIETHLLILPDQGHGFGPSDKQLAQIAAFFKRQLP